ncbi:MAG: glycosyltransferase [Gammaproteobacteria bacterium]|nr:glycosyltransferase [Gammaproteobacteria bacterium]
MKKILMIAFHFPPIKVSSSVQRTLKFSSYLADLGWKAIVLTVKAMASSSVSNEQLKEISPKVTVKRCLALDSSRHLSIKGKYFSWMAWPDRWNSWILSGTLAGIQIIRKYRPDIIWSTYPIVSANVIALIVHKLFKIPWVVDLRDPMIDDWFPSSKSLRKIHKYIEKKLVKNASAIIFTSPGTLNLYKKRYLDIDEAKWILIRNGYDEENFTRAIINQNLLSKKNKKVTLLHSGIIYPDDRDPTHLLGALQVLNKSFFLNSENFELILRATGHDQLIQEMIIERGLEQLVTIAPVISYQEALQEMLSVDGLIVMQGNSCNHQTPAKVYEYLRAAKPILLLGSRLSDSYEILKEVEQANYVADLDNAVMIEKTLAEFIKNIKDITTLSPSSEKVQSFSRKEQTKQLAGVLNNIC